MKKILTLLLSLLMILSLVGCNSKKEEEPTHIHQYEVDEDGVWICTEDSNILSNTDKPYVAVLENNEPKDVMSLDNLSSTKINLGNGTIYKKDNTVYYDGGSAQTIIIKTEKDNKNNEDKVVINAPNDTVYHYGSSSVISLDAVATNSFHEYGKVDLITLTVARIVLETLSNVKEIYLDINNPNYNYESAIIALKEEVEIPKLSRDTVDLKEGEVKTLAVIQQLKDETKQDNTVETKTEEESFVKIENIAKSDNDLIIQAFLSPNADVKDNTKLEKTQTSTTTLEEAKEGSNHPASKNTFVSKDEKVIEVVKPQETSRKDETKQETKQETKPVVTPSVTPKQEETKKDDPKPIPTPTPVYNVTAQVQGSHGTATVKEDGVYITKATKGTNLVFTATPSGGYEFDYWEVVSGGVDIESIKSNVEITIAMPETALTLKAHFKAIVPSAYKIIVEDDGHGTAKAQIGGEDVSSAAPNATVTLVATANDGYAFKEWQIARGLEASDITDNSFTMPSNEVKVKAVFEKEYAIEAEAGGHGSVSADVAKGVSGKEVNLTITPDAGYEVDQITVVRGGVTVTGNKFNIGIADVKIRVTFKAIVPGAYDIIVENDGHGTASADPTSAVPGATVNLTATPNGGYTFKEWQIVRGLDAITGNSFTMPSNEVKVKAIFERVYNITLQTNEHGKASATVGGQITTTAAENAEVTLTAKPDEGYQFKEWKTVSGRLTITDNKFTMPAGNVTIQAVFEAIAPTEYTITFDLNGITGTAPEAQTIKYGGKVNKPADPTTDGYTFGGWYKEATCTNAWDFANDTVTANTTLYAKWKPEDKDSYILKAQGNWFKAFSETTTDKTKITDITFCKELPQGVSAENPVNPTDDNENGKVKGYIVKNGDNYKIYIVGDYIFGNSVCWNMFNGFSNLKTLDFGNFDTSNVTVMFSMFNGCSGLTFLDLSSFDTSETSNMQSMFTGCSKLESITFGPGFKTSKVTSMISMFNGCSALKSLDLSSFVTSEVTQMGSMFKDCSTLESLDLSKFNTAKVEGMPSIFNGCSALKSLDLSKFNTSAVKDMNGMFTGCSKLESITFGTNFDTSKVTAMNAMFSGCSALKSLDLSSFDTSAVTNMDAMFKNCSALKSLDLSKFYTSAVTKMSNMFNGCSTLERLDISNFTVGNGTAVGDMFKDCSELTSVKISPENEMIESALGDGWIYNGETKAYEKQPAALTLTMSVNKDLIDPDNENTMVETEENEPIVEEPVLESEPVESEKKKQEELILPAEAVSEKSIEDTEPDTPETTD